MQSELNEKNVYGVERADKDIEGEHLDAVKPDVVDYKAEAMEAENLEHSMTVIQAAKAYPMACFWAFIMSFCIVSPWIAAVCGERC